MFPSCHTKMLWLWSRKFPRADCLQGTTKLVPLLIVRNSGEKYQVWTQELLPHQAARELLYRPLQREQILPCKAVLYPEGIRHYPGTIYLTCYTRTLSLSLSVRSKFLGYYVTAAVKECNRIQQLSYQICPRHVCLFHTNGSCIPYNCTTLLPKFMISMNSNFIN